MKKQIISMNVDSSIYANFSKLCKEKGIIMSRQVENFMNRFNEENDE